MSENDFECFAKTGVNTRVMAILKTYQLRTDLDGGSQNDNPRTE